MSQGMLKMWVGVGSYVLSGVVATVVGTSVQAAVAEVVDTSAPPLFIQLLAAEGGVGTSAQPVATGGEGGEGGEGAPADQAYGKDFSNKISGPVLLNALRKGGHVIYIRHAQTDKDYADQADPALDLTNCGTQRTLSSKGWEQAKYIGAGFRAAKIPVGTVLASDYCRAWQTADLAFGSFKRNSALNFVKSEEYSPAQRLQMKTAVMPLLTSLPTPGTNTIIVGHDDVFDAATGYYPKPQGMAYVLKPDGRGKFEIVASVGPEAWMMMAKK
jgi:phosphohistidine phosphatase SixA